MHSVVKYAAMKVCHCRQSVQHASMAAFCTTEVCNRKSRDIPRRAPSKIYNVRKPTVTPPDELEVLGDSMRHYRTQVKSIMSFLRAQKRPINGMFKEKKISNVDELAELSKALHINNLWNEEIARSREKRLAEEERKRKESEEEKVSAKLSQLEMEQNIAKQAILRKAERRVNALNMDNLDQSIDSFLDGPTTDHNFAITKAGEKMAGYDKT